MRYLLVILSFFLWGASCSTSKKVTTHNLASMYKKETQALIPEICIYHLSADVSKVYFKINAKDLLYVRSYDDPSFRSHAGIVCLLKYSYDSQEILDSTSVKISDVNKTNVSNKEFVGSLDIRAKAWDNFVIEVIVTDFNRNTYSKTYMPLNKYDNLNAQNFLASYAENNIPVFQQHVDLNKKLNIKYTEEKKANFFVRYYHRNFPIAAPPYSIEPQKPFEYKSDSTFIISSNDSGQFNFICSKPGFYHILADTFKKEGLTLFSFYDGFPEIVTTDQMIEPLRYIMGRQEYEALIYSGNRKTSMEDFWIKTAGSQDRAKELIKKFYSRVKDANLYFTSYIEGWKSDRGMIYIVHGPPNIIYKTSNSESWVYGEENNLMSVTYNFIKVRNPFSSNDFILERANVYKNGWYRAVDIWRQGRVYIDN